MSITLSEFFLPVEKNSISLQLLLGKPLVIVMSQENEIDEFVSPLYAGILECVDNTSVYLKNPYSSEGEEWNQTYSDLFVKLELVREDPVILFPPTLQFDLIDSIYCPKIDLTLEHACNVWGNPKYFLGRTFKN